MMTSFRSIEVTGSVGDMNISLLLTKAARAFGENTAVVQGSLNWTYAEFDERVSRLAGGLRQRGVRPGSRVAMLMHNGPEMLEVMFAAFRAGCIAVPINFRLHPEEFSYIISHSGAVAVFLTPAFNESYASVRSSLASVCHEITTAGAEGDQINHGDLVESGPSVFDDADVDSGDVAWLFYTSGTTGRPKGAMLTHRNLLAMTMNFYADVCPGFGKEEVVLHVAPLSHGSGLYALPNVGRAATHVFGELPSFDPKEVLHLIQQHRVTNLFAAPTMVNRLVESSQVDAHDLGSLSALIYGGGPILAEDLLRAIERFGANLVQIYGLGESPMTITSLRHEDHVQDGTAAQRGRLGSAGTARTDVEVAVVDGQDRPLPVGETGQIVTRSDLVMKGYWKDPEASEETLKGGWLHTGDLGYFDDAGYLFIMDRSKDMIISGGENIYPREIEEVLISHPAVREIAVIGVPDPEWGEAIKAVVATNPGESVTEAALIEFCRQRLASYKKPKSVDFVDGLPKNNYGKIVKKDLREPYWRERGKNI